jgi:Ca-activated chloride channel family protein
MRLRSSGPLVLGFVFASATALHGQVDLSAWPQVRMEVVGTDGNGDPLQGLAAEQVLVRENGHPVAVTELKAASQPMSVCLMIDASGSMYDKRNLVKAAADRFLLNLSAQDEVCIADFSNQLFLDTPFTKDHKLLAQGLGYIKNSGGTALYESVLGMTDYMRKNAHNQSRAFVLLTDGADNASAVSDATLLRDLETAGTPVMHIVLLPSPRGDSNRQETAHSEKAALGLARMDGGLVYFPKDPMELEASVDHLGEAMKNRMVVTYSSDNQSKDGRERRVDVELDKAHQRAKAVVRAPQGYYAPSQ